jgi:hypothetical protein
MLVTGWAVVLLRSLFLFFFVYALLRFLSPCFSVSSSKQWFKEEGRPWWCCC